MSKFAKEAVKKTTGLTGLKVSNDPHRELKVIYDKILSAVAKMPRDAAYRKYTEQIVLKRAEAVKQTSTVADLERIINCGQAEELIQQGRYELDLARKMLSWKPWEHLVQQAPPNQWKWPLK